MFQSFSIGWLSKWTTTEEVSPLAAGRGRTTVSSLPAVW